MLQRIGTGRGRESFDDRHRPVVAGQPADDRTERAPIVERARFAIHVDSEGRKAIFVEVKAVARRASGEAGRQRRGAALVVRACAADRVGVDDDAGVAEGHVLAARGRLDRLVIDAGVGEHDAQASEGRDGPALELEAPRGLLEHARLREIRSTRVCDCRHAHHGVLQRFQPAHARLAEAFAVGHDVRLRHRHEIRGAEELAHLDLMLDRLLHCAPVLAREHGALEIVQIHSISIDPR